jgi:hypothetical protein
MRRTRVLLPLSVLALGLGAWACAMDFLKVQEDCQARGLASGADQTRPSVAFVLPEAGATISGVVEVVATARDNCEVSAVRFTIYSGATLGSDSVPQGADTYSLNWDTRSVANGPVTVAVIADDGHLDLEGHPTPNSDSQTREFTIVNP